MLDVAFIEALKTPLPPARPDLVEQQVWMSEKAEAAKRIGGRLAVEFETAVTDWSDHLAALRSEVFRTNDVREIPPEDIKNLSALIEDVEFQAELRAIGLKRLVKRARRDVAQQKTRDVALGAITRSFANRIVAAERRAIDQMLEHASFLRTLRAEHGPAPTPSGKTVGDLRRQIRSRAAA